jgi:hypothetical protein
METGPATRESDGESEFTLSTSPAGTPRSLRKALRIANTLIGLGALLLILGTGNILYGHYKTVHYRELIEALDSKKRPPASHERVESNQRIRKNQALMSLTSHPDTPGKEAEHKRGLRARMNYYRFSVLGGKCFLALAGICFALSLIFTRREEPVRTRQ